MTPWHDDGQAALYLGDVREVLRALPAESVHCVVTSPPYWSLRDYGIPPSVWGGGADCLHEWADETRQAERYTGKTKWQHIGEEAMATGVKVRDVDPNAWGHPKKSDTATCTQCGAWRGALGLEPTPDLFIDHLVDVFRDVRRVLRPDGVAWVNLGDSYASGGGAHVQGTRGLFTDRADASQGALVSAADSGFRGSRASAAAGAIKAKDLVGVPWMFAFAARADGWYLRSDVIWAKPNPMPESCKDRPTKAHEYFFLFTRSSSYYYDADAIREAATDTGRDNGREGRCEDPRARPPGSSARTLARLDYSERGRNKRSVWSVPTAPFPDAHFATFPPALIRPAILAGCPEGGTVLDPFIGSGTTAMVAKQLGRRCVGIDLNPDYLAMAARRCAQMGLEPP